MPELSDTKFDETLRKVLRMHLPSLAIDAPLPMDVALVDLGLDSLQAVNLVIDLEDTFEVEFPDDVLTEATFRTGESLRQALASLVVHSDA